jgi:hypothetical protein
MPAVAPGSCATMASSRCCGMSWPRTSIPCRRKGSTCLRVRLPWTGNRPGRHSEWDTRP